MNSSEPSSGGDSVAKEATTVGQLQREVGLGGAVMMGLGSILGTGVFVSVGIAAEVAGPAVILAIVVAAGVAICNGLSSAQLAAAHPVSGGTYEYGYRWLNPALGFTAGWMFLCAKSASAATAALGLSGYLLNALDPTIAKWQVPVAVGAVVLVTGLVWGGIRRSNHVNIAIVGVTLLALVVFVLAGLPLVWRLGPQHLSPFFAPVTETLSPTAGFLQASALMFVAFTGYGRIATLAEEVRRPRWTIPRAVIVTLIVSMVLYMAVGLVGLTAVGAADFAAAGVKDAAPLQYVARQFDVPGVAILIGLGAVTAMLGVLLNLVLGLSRVVLAMGRRRDLPTVLAGVDPRRSSPNAAVLLVGCLIVGLVLIGDVRTTWSFSAMTVLVYYALTNLAAIRLDKSERLYPQWIPWLGLISCLFLVFWIDLWIWVTGGGLIALGLLWQRWIGGGREAGSLGSD